ncbi:tetrahydrofolate dehydrogenase/cyclohydrolase-like protein [Streptomyces sp. 846.5]|nr:hypothetical protein [Streptomyces sp. 846.5]TDU02161.1 tetrahydrofolate dehydrogenase/cyclohydrolase-like protein [Streptomyces sp. 846.5]
MTDVLVLADHADGAVRSSTLELLALAGGLGEPTAVVFLDGGDDIAAVLEELARHGATAIRTVTTAGRRAHAAIGKAEALACTPRGIVELLRRHEVPLDGSEVVVVGRGVTVGRPLGLLLTRRSENATVTLCHTGTRDLARHLRGADIVVAAAGVAGLVTADLVKPGAAVLDVGITRVDGRLVGDVAPEVREVAGWLAPMPGGVGPMTRAMLLANVVEAAERGSGRG